jgi:hypothetical protein
MRLRGGRGESDARAVIESDSGVSGRQVMAVSASNSSSSSCEKAEAVRDLRGSLL